MNIQIHRIGHDQISVKLADFSKEDVGKATEGRSGDFCRAKRISRR